MVLAWFFCQDLQIGFEPILSYLSLNKKGKYLCPKPNVAMRLADLSADDPGSPAASPFLYAG